ncbi:hypothetical protein R1flu_022944 [Riccia fluitans]|uniref:Uncharacterized protein n=1 Tax=Riccia fluitans TaxID=41844 RepID=A0ABD1XQM4_9MARC
MIHLVEKRWLTVQHSVKHCTCLRIGDWIPFHLELFMLMIVIKIFVFIDGIHDNPKFKQFKREAIEDVIATRIFGSLRCNGLKYIPYPSLGKKADKDDADKEASECLHREKKKAPLEKKKKKGTSVASKKLLDQLKRIAESQAASDKALDDIPLPTPSAKRKRTIRGPNVSSRDESCNTSPSEDPTVEAPTSSL